MEDELITFETAKLAKEKGFDEHCLMFYEDKQGYINCSEDNCDGNETSYYNNNTDLKSDIKWTAPSQSLLQRWLREKHKINISMINGSNTINLYYYEINKTNKFPIKGDGSKNYTYEQALEEGLYKALELIKTK